MYGVQQRHLYIILSILPPLDMYNYYYTANAKSAQNLKNI